MLVHETIRIMNMCYYRFLKLVAVPCVTIAMAYEFWHSFDLKCLHYEIINGSYNYMSHISHTQLATYLIIASYRVYPTHNYGYLIIDTTGTELDEAYRTYPNRSQGVYFL